MNSATVSDNQDATAAQYNNLRKDVIEEAGEYIGTPGGTGDAITLSIDAQITAYKAGQKFKFKAGAANTTVTTLNVNSLGAKTIKKNYNKDLIANDIKNGQIVEVEYDGTNMQMVSQFGNQYLDTIIEVNAGEAVDVSSNPQAVYLKSTDGEFYKTDADAMESTYKFAGFAITTGSDGNPFYVIRSGIVSGFSGLTAGSTYYLSGTAGAISTTPGTYQFKVGIAISTTQLMIEAEPVVVYGVQAGSHAFGAGSENYDIAVTCGFRPSKIELKGLMWRNGADPTGGLYHSSYTTAGGTEKAYGGWNVWFDNGSYYGTGWSHVDNSLSDITNGLLYVNFDNGETALLTIVSVTETGFTFRIAKSGADAQTGDYRFMYKVYK